MLAHINGTQGERRKKAKVVCCSLPVNVIKMVNFTPFRILHTSSCCSDPSRRLLKPTAAVQDFSFLALNKGKLTKNKRSKGAHSDVKFAFFLAEMNVNKAIKTHCRVKAFRVMFYVSHRILTDKFSLPSLSYIQILFALFQFVFQPLNLSRNTLLP